MPRRSTQGQIPGRLKKSIILNLPHYYSVINLENLLLVLVLILWPSPVVATGLPLSGQRSVGPYTPGQELEIQYRITHDGSPVALGVHEELPTGWRVVDVQGTAPPNAFRVVNNAVEFVWYELPFSPVEFTYALAVPIDASGVITISGQLLYRDWKSGELIGSVSDTLVEAASPTPTPSPSSTVTVADTPIPPTATPSSTQSYTPTATPTLTSTYTSTNTPQTETPTVTLTHTMTESFTPNPPTNTPSMTATETATILPPSLTPTFSATSTPTQTLSPEPPTFTSTETPTITRTPIAPVWTSTTRLSPSPTITPTISPTSTKPTIQGDINRDGVVNYWDLMIFAGNWSKIIGQQ